MRIIQKAKRKVNQMKITLQKLIPFITVFALIFTLIGCSDHADYISETDVMDTADETAQEIAEEIISESIYEEEEGAESVTSYDEHTEENLSEPESAEESEKADENAPLTEETTTETTEETAQLKFRSDKLLEQHFQKHGIEMGFSTPEEYEKAAAAVVAAPGVLHKTEAEDGDDVYYIEETNEFVIVSTDGYIRTYFYPSKGIEYFNRQ